MAGFISNPKNRDPERAVSLQRYLVLHSQQESLRQKLYMPSGRSSRSSSQSSSRSSSSNSTPGNMSPVHPQMPRRMHSRTLSRTPSVPRHSSMPEPIPEEDEPLEDEQKLWEVNQQIKSTLTKLLHCAGTMNDRNFHSWVSERLTDIDIELSGQGRRNSN